LDTPPIEARSSEKLPDSAGLWQYEPKWDGFRCLAFKSGDMVDLRAKSGKPLGRYFPEVIALLREVAAPQFVVDGELISTVDWRLMPCKCVCIPQKAGSKSSPLPGAADAVRYARCSRRNGADRQAIATAPADP
jgi:ATP dependent DNA ligase domain